MVSSGYGALWPPDSTPHHRTAISHHQHKMGQAWWPCHCCWFDEILYPVLENLGRIVWARGFFLILVFICCVTEVKLSLFDYLNLLAVELICALAAVWWVVSSFEIAVGSKEVILHSTLRQKTEHTGRKTHHSPMQKLLSATRNPPTCWRGGGWVLSHVLLCSLPPVAAPREKEEPSKHTAKP